MNNPVTQSPIWSTLKGFFLEPIPKSIGWRNTLGSLVGSLILAQILTGFLLAIYYVPHPDSATISLTWLQENITGGALIRALHYWGASFIVVALFLHALRVFSSGAYRRPRQALWLSGLVLLGITVTLAFTGQLLPFNQSGYWAAKVGVEIAASAPVLGPVIKEAMLGGATIGELTLTRFYALHVILLPLMLGAMVALHLFLLRKHTPLRANSDKTDHTVSFFPLQFARDMIVASVGLVGLIGVALLAGTPGLEPLDLANSDYIPRPEWYFFSHFELLRMTPSSLELLTTFVLPSVLVLAMCALPWLDRPLQGGSRRKPVLAAGLLIALSIAGLTAKGMIRAQSEHTIESAGATEVSSGSDDAQATLAAGRRVLMQEKCLVCHKLNGRGGTKALDLGDTGTRLKEDYLRAWLRDPEAFRPDTVMPAVGVPDGEFDNLVAFLMSLETED